MKRLAIIVLAGCVDASDPPWQLDHDRVLAVAADPAGLVPGGSARITGLLAHRGAPVDEEQPVAMTVVSPHELVAAVHYNIDHWQVDCPAVSAPTALEVEMRFPPGEVATRTVWLGMALANPQVSATVPDPFPRGRDVDLGPGEWFTSCGTLRGSVLRVDAPCDGQAVDVVRDDAGGTGWQVLALHAP